MDAVGLPFLILVGMKGRVYIEAAITRMPRFCRRYGDLSYVEGHSSDGTFEECERVRDAYAGEWNIRVAQQDGKGKGDAVRESDLDMASKDIL